MEHQVVIKKILLIISGLLIALVAVLLLLPMWPPTRDHVALVSLLMSTPRQVLNELCSKGRPVTGAALRAAGMAPRYRPTVLVQEMGTRDGKSVVVSERREPAKEIDEMTIRVEPRGRVVLTATLPEVRSGFKHFDTVSFPKGSTITMIGECREKMMAWSVDRATTTVPHKFLTTRMREELK